MRKAFYRSVDAFESRYQDVKRSHEKNVLNRLGMIAAQASGRAILAELGRSFLDQNMARVLLAELRIAQQLLFDALAKVNAPFNPIKQIDDERRKLQGNFV